MLAGRVQCPCAPAGPRTFLQRVSGPLGAAPNAISTPRSPGSPGGRQVWRLLTAAPGSPGPQHQQRVACKAGPRLGHLPTGRGRGLRGSGRSDSGARISGSGGLCRGARGSASSGVGGGRGRRGRGRIVRRRGAKRGGRNGGERSCGVPKSRSAPSSRRRDARGLAQVPAAAPTVREPAALQAEGGELRWRDARPVPASSSARPGARAALVRCGGGPRARRPGLAVRAAAAASCLPGATSEPQTEEPRGGASPPTPGPAAPPRRAARAASAGLGPL